MLTVEELQQKRLPPWPPIDVVAAATHQRKAAIPGQVGTGAEEQDDPPKLRRPPNFRAKIIPAAAPHHAFPSIPELGLNWAEYMSWLGFLYIAEGKICSSLRRSTARSPLPSLSSSEILYPVTSKRILLFKNIK